VIPEQFFEDFDLCACKWQFLNSLKLAKMLNDLRREVRLCSADFESETIYLGPIEGHLQDPRDAVSARQKDQ